MELLKTVYRYLFGKYSLSTLISRSMIGCRTVLDVGCGRRSSLSGIKKCGLRVGVDHYMPYIKEQAGSVHDFYVQGDVRRLPFKDKSFDCAVATEIIEHLIKEDALKMLAEMERVSNKIILTTPNGFLPTYPGPLDNPEEAHLSGWSVMELKELGFQVYGISGLKALWTIKDGQSVMRVIPKKVPLFSTIVADMTEPFVYKHPHRAFRLFFVKDGDNGRT
ncbi:MAG: class I SAM-dependent methyltransferase [Candidatus Brocadia sinica]|nr:class I SAM-dependent methyltransferase [Candidatus Brocadia sinica]